MILTMEHWNEAAGMDGIRHLEEPNQGLQHPYYPLGHPSSHVSEEWDNLWSRTLLIVVHSVWNRIKNFVPFNLQR